MNPSASPLRTASYFCAVVLTFLLCEATAQDVPVARRIGACSGAVKGQSLIGSGKYGLFFSVPKRGVKVSGGKPDVDYVKFVVKSTNHEGALALWFGPMALQPDPPGEILASSPKRDKRCWRWFGVWAEGAVYEDTSAEAATQFDQIIDSACLIPSPNH